MAESTNFDKFLGMVNGIGTAYINKKYQNDTSQTVTVPSQAAQQTSPITPEDKEFKLQFTPMQIGGLIIAGLLTVVLITRLAK